MAMAHAVGNAVENAYRRRDLFERRRALAERWARYCAGDAEVVNFPAAGAVGIAVMSPGNVQAIQACD